MDEPTGKNLVCKKVLPISEKKWKTCWGGGGGVASTTPLAIGGLRGKKLRKMVPKKCQTPLSPSPRSTSPRSKTRHK